MESGLVPKDFDDLNYNQIDASGKYFYYKINDMNVSFDSSYKEVLIMKDHTIVYQGVPKNKEQLQIIIESVN